MKINRLETHDRLKYLIKDQSVNVFEGAEECFKRNPLSLAIQDRCPYIYIFAHARTADDGVTKVLHWHPRMSIPEAQSNSYLFRGISKSDEILICWLLPAFEMWEQYKMGNVTESKEVLWSIKQYETNKKNLEKPHPQDWPEEKTKPIMQAIINEKLQEIRMNKYIKPELSEVSQDSSS